MNTLTQNEAALIPFFERVTRERPYPFMAHKIYGPDLQEEVIIQKLLDEMGIVNPYADDYHFDELRKRFWYWGCVNTTNWLIAEGKETSSANLKEWRKWI